MRSSRSALVIDGMRYVFVPYQGNHPAALLIKGHRFVILARDPGVLDDQLDLIGADNVREVQTSSPDEEDRVLCDLAEQIDGGIVVAPGDVELGEIIENLEGELPWLH